MNMEYISESKIGLRRLYNEDTVGVTEVDNGVLMCVCDGIGGKKAGDVASSIAVDSIIYHFCNSKTEDYIQRIHEAIIFANSAILEKSQTVPECSGMATTAEVLFIKDNVAYWGHVGDSRIYYLCESEMYCITKDHSFVQKLVDDGYITDAQAQKHPQRNIIMRAVGDDSIVEADLDKMFIDAGKRWKFFVCTDGVSSVLTNEEISDLLYNSDLKCASDKIIKAVEDKGAPDNFSYVIICGS